MVSLSFYLMQTYQLEDFITDRISVCFFIYLYRLGCSITGEQILAGQLQAVSLPLVMIMMLHWMNMV